MCSNTTPNRPGGSNEPSELPPDGVDVLIFRKTRPQYGADTAQTRYRRV